MHYNHHTSTRGNGTGKPDPKSRMVEHIISQYNSADNYVRSVMNETKVGAIRQPAIMNMIRNVISQY